MSDEETALRQAAAAAAETVLSEAIRLLRDRYQELFRGIVQTEQAERLRDYDALHADMRSLTGTILALEHDVRQTAQTTTQLVDVVQTLRQDIGLLTTAIERLDARLPQAAEERGA